MRPSVTNKCQPVIIGMDHYNTLGLIRSFGEKGYKPILILLGDCEIEKCLTAKSKYANEIHITSPKEAINVLKNLKCEWLPILFPSGDKAAELIDRNLNYLNKKFICPNINNTSGAVIAAMDKENMRSRAQQYGLLTPHTWQIKEDLTTIDGIEYPCIIKACASINGPKSYEIIHNTEELATAVSIMRDTTQDIIVQNFIKKDYEIIFLGYSHNGKIGIPCVMKKIREYPQNFGCTGLGIISPNIEEYLSLKQLKEFIKSYNYSGLFSVEFIVSGEQIYFLEINFRNDGNGYFPGKGGVNIADDYIQLISGNDIDYNRRVDRTYRMMREFTDLNYVRTSGYSKLSWIKDILTTDVFQYWNNRDPKPFVFLLKRKIQMKINYKDNC